MADRKQQQFRLRVDGGEVFSPAWQRFNNQGQFVGTPSVKTGLTGDIYLSLPGRPSDDPATPEHEQITLDELS